MSAAIRFAASAMSTLSRARWCAAALGLALLATLAVTASAAQEAGAAAGTDSLYPGESLAAGQHLYSGDRTYDLTLQSDGNLVLYWRAKPIWHTSTGGRGGTALLLQSDGNLVLYTPSMAPIWHTATYGSAPGRLVVQNDGNLVIYAANGTARWSSASQASRWSDGDSVVSPDGRFRATMQVDGNFVFYGPSGVVWHSNTYRAANAFLIVQRDGNLVIYSNAVPIWNSGTWRSGPVALSATNSGRLQLATPGGAVQWSVPSSTPVEELVVLLNNYRASLGLVQETYSPELAGYSASCANAMAAANAPLAHCRTNEIVQYNTAATAQAWFAAWLDSPPHKQLIEYPSNRFVGAAVAYNPTSGRYYIVMNFA